MQQEERTCLPISTEDIEMLSEPCEFFAQTVSFLRTAQRRVVLSALYLGTGAALEQQLLQELAAALQDPLRPTLTVTLILDHSRSQRRGPPASTASTASASTSIDTLPQLATLIRLHGVRLQVYLYEMPALRTMWMRFLPYEMREVLGVYHCKFAVCDDVVLLTGANLSSEYFTTRQDRYWRLGGDSGLVLATFLMKFSDIVGSDSSVLQGNCTLVDPHPSSSAECGLALHRLLHNASTVNGNIKNNDNATCVPLIQLADRDIMDEQNAICDLLRELSCSTKPVSIYLATPYSNFPLPMLKQLLLLSDAGGNVEFIFPGPFAHGFSTARGIKQFIPALHREALRSTIEDILLLPASRIIGNLWNINMKFESYCRTGWTYHVKGIWWKSSERPSGCYIGSSNFGIRSWSRDFELGFLFQEAKSSNGSSPFLKDFIHLKRFTETDLSFQSKISASANFVFRSVARIFKSFL